MSVCQNVNKRYTLCVDTIANLYLYTYDDTSFSSSFSPPSSSSASSSSLSSWCSSSSSLLSLSSSSSSSSSSLKCLHRLWELAIVAVMVFKIPMSQHSIALTSIYGVAAWKGCNWSWLQRWASRHHPQRGWAWQTNKVSVLFADGAFAKSNPTAETETCRTGCNGLRYYIQDSNMQFFWTVKLQIAMVF